MKGLTLACFLYPLKDKTYISRGKTYYSTSYIVVEHSLKFSTNDEHLVRLLHVSSTNFLELGHKIENMESSMN